MFTNGRGADNIRRRKVAGLLPLLCSVTLLLVSCAPATRSGSGGTGDGQGSGSTGSTANQGMKTIRIAMQLQQEPVDKGSETGIISITGPGNAGGSGALEHRLTFHAGLTVLDERQVQQPRLAESVPNLQDGSWKTFDDGRMEVTWKLKPNLSWHDGAPLTADDFVFGTTIARDPDFVGPPPATGTRQLSEVVAPDPQTIVVRFPQPYVGGNLGDNVPALPSHLLKDLYDRGEKDRIQTSTYWTTDFVGLGPYKLARWESGSFIEAHAFDQYVLGRPKTDRIFLHYYCLLYTSPSPRDS